MRTRTRFALLYACISVAVMAIGVAAIYEAVGLDSARRIPAEAEGLLDAAARRAIDPAAGASERLEDATESLLAARALLAEGRVLAKDAVVRLALEVAIILAAVLLAAALAFLLLSRLITKGLDELAAGALVAKAGLALGERTRRFARSADPDLDAVAAALNELLDLAAEQERRLGEAARLEGWREVASFLAHQLKNPLAALFLAAENGSLALGEADPPPRPGLARESLRIARVEAGRLRALIDRFRDLAPAGFDAYGSTGELDLGALLAECAARAQRSGATVAIAGPDTGPIPRDPRERIAGDRSGLKIAGDKGLLEQAFWNLFANSIEAAAESGEPVSIRLLMGAEGGEATVLFQDSNRGIDPALIPRLGRERFSTKAAGTGLGLVLVRRILAAQGGALELFATDTGGLGARIRLPLAGAAAGAAPGSAAGQRKAT